MERRCQILPGRPVSNLIRTKKCENGLCTRATGDSSNDGEGNHRDDGEAYSLSSSFIFGKEGEANHQLQASQ